MSKKNNNKSSTDSNTKSDHVKTETVPEEFKTVIHDFISDFSNTFPEYSDSLEEYFTTVSVVSDDGSGVKTERLINDDSVNKLYMYCKDVYPARFFDILYKNGDIFKHNNSSDESSKMDVNFLPNIDFVKVWNTPDISDNTRNTLWKYLQLILFSIITNISDRDSFGETAKLFEAINEDELKTKLEETFKNMQSMFMSDSGESGKSGENAKFDRANMDNDMGTGSGMGMDMKDFEKLAEQFKNMTGENGEIDMSKFPGLSGFPGAAGQGWRYAQLPQAALYRADRGQDVGAAPSRHRRDEGGDGGGGLCRGVHEFGQSRRDRAVPAIGLSQESR